MAQEEPRSDSVTDRALLATSLAAHEARIKQIEDKIEDKTIFGSVQKKASFIALMIGIVLSGFSLFDVFWSKPREALFRDMAEFNKTVNAVASLRQNAAQLQFQTSNPQMIEAMNSMVMPQILANIQYATALLPRLEDNVGIPQLIVLIYEAMNIYDWQSARVLVDRAVAIKTAVPTMQSEAHRYRARLLFMTGQADEGRKAFEDALNIMGKEDAFGINGPRAYVVKDWVLSEFMVGECGLTTERVNQFLKLLNHPQVMGQMRLGMASSLRAQLEQLQSTQTKCAIPAELLAATQK